MRRGLLVGAAATWSLMMVSASVAPAQRFTITDLGTLPGHTLSRGLGLSENGIATGQSETSYIHGHAFSWRDGTMTDLPPLDTDDHSTGEAVNNAGVVVGSSYYFVMGYPYAHAVRWVDGVPEALPAINGSLCAALDINKLGYVVGWAQVIPGPPWTDAHACMWTPDGTPIDLGTLGGSFSLATGINEAGQVVGGADVTSGTRHAFLWQPSSAMIDLGTLGGDHAEATAINSAGVVVGYSEIEPGDELRHAFVWEGEGHMRDLGTLGGPRSEAYDINTRGWIVGTADDSDGNRHACLWIDGVPHDLFEMVVGTGWDELVEARAINDRNQIVGTGYIGEDYHAFLLEQVRIPGDVDGDGDVDLEDLAALLAAYGSCTGDANYNPAADFDDSGCVDLADLSVLLAHYGE